IDTTLNERGLRQAMLVGHRLQSEEFDAMYCSDLTRCKETLEAILHYQSAATPVIYKRGLRERDFGKLSGNPVGFLASESKRLSIDVNELVKRSGGESENEFASRVIEAYLEIVTEANANGYQNILVVTHGGPMHILSLYWIKSAGFRLGAEPTQSMYRHGNTAVTRISIGSRGDDGVVEYINSTTHLDETQKSGMSIAV
ncbi:histidine phosphatase superfamily, partial [Dichotomocladium elegans]